MTQERQALTVPPRFTDEQTETNGGKALGLNPQGVTVRAKQASLWLPRYTARHLGNVFEKHNWKERKPSHTIFNLSDILHETYESLLSLYIL